MDVTIAPGRVGGGRVPRVGVAVALPDGVALPDCGSRDPSSVGSSAFRFGDLCRLSCASMSALNLCTNVSDDCPPIVLPRPAFDLGGVDFGGAASGPFAESRP